MTMHDDGMVGGHGCAGGGDVLLVDDSDLDAERIERAFSRLGVRRTLVRAHDGVEALERLAAASAAPEGGSMYALVLLDLNMPRMNGLEMLRACEIDAGIVLPPVLVMSTSAPALEQARLSSGHECLVKPASLPETVVALAASTAVGPFVTRDDICLVDDDADVHELARRLVRRTPRRLTSLHGAHQARAHLSERDVELLIVDARMPDGDGLDLLETLGSAGTVRAARTVLSSAGRLDGRERDRADALGIEVIVKGELFDRQRFAEHIGRRLPRAA